MVVVAIIGVLAAVAISRYLKAGAGAATGAAIGEQIGLAKECATRVVAQVGTAPTTGNPACGTVGGTFSASWSATVDNLKCLGATANRAQRVTVGVNSTGAMSCSLG